MVVVRFDFSYSEAITAGTAINIGVMPSIIGNISGDWFVGASSGGSTWVYVLRNIPDNTYKGGCFIGIV